MTDEARSDGGDGGRAGVPDERWAEFETPDGDRWRVDVGFLRSSWTCIWGAGCRGIGPLADPTHVMGCCTLGAEFANTDDAMNVAAHAAFLDAKHWQFAEVGEREGIFADDTRRATRVVDGGCIFLNRPGFEGGAGCALHHAALADDEPPRDWKPIVCWQLPFRVDVARDERAVEGDAEQGADDEGSVDDGDAGVGPGSAVTIVRRWARADFDDPGDETPPIPWLCTEDPAAYVGDGPALDRHRDDLVELLGEDAVAAIESLVSRP